MKRHFVSSVNYFISYTDLLVGLLFIFLILLMTFAMTAKSTEAELEGELKGVRTRIAMRNQLLRDIAQDLQPEVQVRVDYDQGVLRFGESVLFKQGDDELSNTARAALTRLRQSLERRLPCYTDRPPRNGCPPGSAGLLEAVFIEGHTDMSRINTRRFPSNWHLSAARAFRTYAQLTETDDPATERDESVLGSMTNGSQQALLSASAYAERRPVRRRQNLDENRRIDIRFLIASHSGHRADVAGDGR